MPALTERTIANMDVVLDKICRGLSDIGGDHDSRAFIARKLKQACRKGNTTLGGLETVGRKALADLMVARPDGSKLP